MPEELGGARNWDYRYTWMRDAAFTLYALLRIGFTEEAAHFMEWLGARCRDCGGRHPLQIVYGIDGRRDLKESTLDHLAGYRGSRPVRIGNGAYDQLQLDIYGELMDSVYLFNKYGAPISADLWTAAPVPRQLGVRQLAARGRGHLGDARRTATLRVLEAHVLGRPRSGPSTRREALVPRGPRALAEERDAIYEEVMTRGWSERRGSFVQRYDSEAIDASNLIMPLVFFLSPVDPKMLDMLEAVSRSPREGGLLSGGLVYRYDNERPEDGLLGREGTFNMCTFWLVEALTRAGRTDRRKLEEARFLFERMLGYGNHLGLYAEQTSGDGQALGNYPQALTHLALISAAYSLDRALNDVR